MKKTEPKTYLSPIKCADVVYEAKERLDRGEILTVFDLETTGLSHAADRILSFSACKIRKNHGLYEEVDRMNLFINPGFHIPETITAINHIDDDTVRSCGTEDVEAYKIREFLGDHPFLAGYNSISFDEPFLKMMFTRVFGVEYDFSPVCHLDVLKLSREKLPIKSHTLAAVCHELGADGGIEFHNSMDDVIATFRSLKCLLDMYDPEEPAPKYTEHYVVAARYWDGPSHKHKRIYVVTSPASKTYYDIYYNRWESSVNFDLDKVRTDVFRRYNVRDEKELLRTLR